ncbi:MAG: type IV pilus biogenesis/stability protein PilW [Rhodocyclaceae bacterium]|nr:type IV pilus biogenesis/stability protein PilW [Rhodocyclaceae bacterium]
MTRRLRFGLYAILLCLSALVRADGGGVSYKPSGSEGSPENSVENRAKVHTELGSAYFQAGRMAVALEEGESAVQADPRYAPAYNLLGLVHMYLRESALARLNFEKALKLAPGDAEINNNYGWFLCQNGQVKDSFAYFMKAVKEPLYPTPTKAWYNAGMCALLEKDNEAAGDYFMKAVMADRRNTQALYRVAEYRYTYGNLYEAQRFIAEVLRISQPDPAALWLALRIERKLGNRAAETGYANQLRWKFQGTPEYQAMIQGKFE